MEKPLDDLINRLGKDAPAKVGKVEPWYNSAGDCIEYLTVQEAFVADRIDSFLTIYRSAENNNPIGFQLKDVQALVEKYDAERFKFEYGVEAGKLVSVSAVLVNAFAEEAPSIARRQGYATATSVLAGDQSRDRVALSA